MFGAKISGKNIFGEQMFGGFFIKSPKISVHNFGEKETFHRNRHLVDRNICSHTFSGNSILGRIKPIASYDTERVKVHTNRTFVHGKHFHRNFSQLMYIDY